MSDSIIVQDNEHEPVVFTQDELGWLPWLEPLPEAELTERHFAGLVDRSRAKSNYFRLLVRDPEVLEARTKTDKDIFYNTADGLPRAERELAAAATSRFNGCIYCASVHSRRFADLTKKPETMQGLFDGGLEAELEPRLRAIADFAERLSRSPHRMTATDLAPLREAGLDDLQILDLIHATAMFANANRLMQTLGESVPPQES